MPRENKRVVVVGASVAGLFAAYRLAEAGIPVRVFEARGAPQPEPRTLIVTPAYLRLLDFNVEEAVLNRTHTFELVSHGASARVELREPDVVLERARFMRLLLERARGAGAEVVLGQRFEGLERERTPPLLRFRNGRGPEYEEAATIIGADGVDSSVARAVDQAGVETVAIVQARVPLPADLPSHRVRCWFDRGSTRFFYWLIPESDQTGALGLIADTEEQAQAALERFLSARDLEPMGFQRASVAMYTLGARPTARLGGGRVMLVGDAAGQVKVTTVGGVVTGLRGGAAAARAVVRGTSYAREARDLRWELRAHALLRHLLDGLGDEDYDRMLGLLNERSVGVLSRYHRDELTRALWRLLVAQPRWLALGARGLVAGTGERGTAEGGGWRGEDGAGRMENGRWRGEDGRGAGTQGESVG